MGTPRSSAGEYYMRAGLPMAMGSPQFNASGAQDLAHGLDFAVRAEIPD
jgi:hypothetical protein